jgi:hypothetical protein
MSTNVDKAWLASHPGFEQQARRAMGSAYVRRDRAHPYAPGSGPTGQTCGTCAKCIQRREYRRNFYKCRVMQKSWSRGPSTDIRLKDKACLAWEPKIDRVEPINVAHRGCG